MLIYLLIFCELFVDYLPNSVLLLSFLLQETEMEPRPPPQRAPSRGYWCQMADGRLGDPPKGASRNVHPCGLRGSKNRPATWPDVVQGD